MLKLKNLYQLYYERKLSDKKKIEEAKRIRMAVRKEIKQRKEETKRQLVFFFSKQKAKSDESSESEPEPLENLRSSSGGSNLVESSSDEEFTLP